MTCENKTSKLVRSSREGGQHRRLRGLAPPPLALAQMREIPGNSRAASAGTSARRPLGIEFPKELADFRDQKVRSLKRGEVAATGELRLLRDRVRQRCQSTNRTVAKEIPHPGRNR
jgi:hypothetical protein